MKMYTSFKGLSEPEYSVKKSNSYIPNKMIVIIALLSLIFLVIIGLGVFMGYMASTKP